MTERVKVVRVLTYEGPRSWVESQLRNRHIRGEQRWSPPHYGALCVIHEELMEPVPIEEKSDGVR